VTDFRLEEKRYNPYFIAFLKAKRLNIGDTVKGYEYINWIQDKHREFRKEYKLPKEKEWIGYTQTEQSIFEKWLDEKADCEALENWIANGLEKV
jgi:hypothetical protein